MFDTLLVEVASIAQRGQINQQYLVYMFMGRFIKNIKSKTSCWHVKFRVLLSLYIIFVQSREVGITCFHSLY